LFPLKSSAVPLISGIKSLRSLMSFLDRASLPRRILKRLGFFNCPSTSSSSKSTFASRFLSALVLAKDTDAAKGKVMSSIKKNLANLFIIFIPIKRLAQFSTINLLCNIGTVLIKTRGRWTQYLEKS